MDYRPTLTSTIYNYILKSLQEAIGNEANDEFGLLASNIW